MSLHELPPTLKDTTGENCFLSCVGMALAHYEKLGSLCLADIIEAVEIPGEEVTPMARVFAWLISGYGLDVEYIEEMDETDQDSADLIASFRNAGVTYTPLRPTMADMLRYVDRDIAVITLVNYDNMGADNPNLELNHAIYLGSCHPSEAVSVIEPNGAHFAIEDISEAWGDYPNLIIFRDKSNL